MTKGSLHNAVMSSCAVPGLFPPQVSGDHVLVDSSQISDVPIDAARELGRDAPLLAVHLIRPERHPTGFENSMEMAVRINAITRAALVREQLTQADMILPIPMQDIGWLGFRQSEECVRLGEESAMSDVPPLFASFLRAQP